jgi:hypothetical protein
MGWASRLGSITIVLSSGGAVAGRKTAPSKGVRMWELSMVDIKHFVVVIFGASCFDGFGK